MVKLDIDLTGLRRLFDLGDRADGLVRAAARDLTAMGHAKATELARDRLKSRRKMFVEALSATQVDPTTWHITLNARAVWIDDGMPPRDMLKDLLKSPKAKVSKSGHRYIAVPFRHGPGKEEASDTQAESVDAIKAEMKRRGIPWAGVERDPSGRPLYGRIHAFSVDSPLKGGAGPGQGHGFVGAPRQGMSARNAAVNQGAGGFESSKSNGGGIGLLQGVSVYQKPMPYTGKKELVYRDVVTFRIASEKHAGSGRWAHPGTKPANIFKDVHEWMVRTWEQDIAPSIVGALR